MSYSLSWNFSIALTSLSHKAAAFYFSAAATPFGADSAPFSADSAPFSADAAPFGADSAPNMQICLMSRRRRIGIERDG